MYIDISEVVELITYEVDKNTVILGAGITLNQAMNIFDSLSNRKGFAYMNQMREHVDLIAHVPVRNVSDTFQIIVKTVFLIIDIRWV